MPVPPARALLALAAFGAIASCATFDGLTAGDGGDTPDGSTSGPDGADVDAEALDGGGQDDSAVDAGADGTIIPDAAFVCPAGPGPVMVKVGTYCVDGTEVTNAHYEAFLAQVQSNAAAVAGLPAACGFKTAPGLTPANWPQAAAKASRPVAWVDWCDAYAYCKWAGKRLCGAIAGGSLPPAEYKDAAASQWFGACSHGGDGQHAFPYGSTYDPDRCNGLDRNNDAGLTIDVAAATNCVGGFPGIFDMSGNVEEWEDTCTATTGAKDDCQVRGGAADDVAAAMRCERNARVTRDYRSAHKGFRCCAP
jgi:formylglycine-generating enzyme required for sulfatase activity